VGEKEGRREGREVRHGGEVKQNIPTCISDCYSF